MGSGIYQSQRAVWYGVMELVEGGAGCFFLWTEKKQSWWVKTKVRKKWIEREWCGVVSRRCRAGISALFTLSKMWMKVSLETQCREHSGAAKWDNPLTLVHKVREIKAMNN